MKTTRRKFQIYPVALAIALLIATSARAQLCPTAATTSGATGFIEQTDPASSLAKASEQNPAGLSAMIAQPVPMTNDVQADFASVLATEASARNVLPKAAVAQNATVTSSRPSDDVVRQLLLATSQPALAEASLQPMFAD
jgi:hypothetical protein